ncbi:peptidylprolyl isomerase [Haloferula rosea]|uniref:peptidylprolyl isomerase n=1 Tax=Haloferula rosea TaxID=490093 RepID=A0A934VG48_9BACT|nr:peptidylprolyl isomerase [Haloferula rosea]MBK1827672.1 peptidylprolyl isomerase [Haloferula rosea]
MKVSLCSLILIAGSITAVRAETSEGDGIFAQFVTNKGTIEVVLEYEKAPKTVANFITLAEGTRNRIDPNTGRLTRAPLYNGQTFYSVVNEFGFFPLPSTFYALTGSGTSSSVGGPGYAVPDEFDASLRHNGYNVSMSALANFTGTLFGPEINRGPNTNGSQIMFTGNTILTRFDDVNSIFGSVTDPASRAVVDAIIFGGAGTTTISNVTIERVGQAALDFDEHAQNLPYVGPPLGELRVEENAVHFDHDEPLGSGSFFSFRRSSDLLSWSPTTRRHIDPDFGTEPSTQLDEIAAPKAFFDMLLTRHPGGLSPATLANRTLVLNTAPPNVITYTFVFDSTGTGGTTNYSVDASDGVITSLSYVAEGYGASLQITSSNIPTPLRARLGFDSEDASNLIGRHFLEGFNDPFWSPIGSGQLTLSK